MIARNAAPGIPLQCADCGFQQSMVRSEGATGGFHAARVHGAYQLAASPAQEAVGVVGGLRSICIRGWRGRWSLVERPSLRARRRNDLRDAEACAEVSEEVAAGRACGRVCPGARTARGRSVPAAGYWGECGFRRSWRRATDARGKAGSTCRADRARGAGVASGASASGRVGTSTSGRGSGGAIGAKVARQGRCEDCVRRQSQPARAKARQVPGSLRDRR